MAKIRCSGKRRERPNNLLTSFAKIDASLPKKLHSSDQINTFFSLICMTLPKVDDYLNVWYCYL